MRQKMPSEATYLRNSKESSGVCVSHVNRRVVKSQFCLTDAPLSVFQLCASNKYYNYLLDSYCDKYCAVITWKRCNLSDR